jgi:hypothetical protein
MPEAFDPYRAWLGIPPERQPPDHYALLGLRRFEASREAILAAARKRAAQLKPHQSGPHADACRRLLRELAEAQKVLADEKQRAAYDRSLRAADELEPLGEGFSAGSLLDELFDEAAGAGLESSGGLALDGAAAGPLLAPLPKKRGWLDRLVPAGWRGKRALWLAAAGALLLAAGAAWLVAVLVRPSAEAMLAKADAAYESGNYAEAVRHFEALRRRHGPQRLPAGARVRYGVARLHRTVDGGDPTAALAEAQSVLSEISGLGESAADEREAVADLLLRLVERLADEADKHPSAERLAAGWQAVALAEDYAQAADPFFARLHRAEFVLGRAAWRAAGPLKLDPVIVGLRRTADTAEPQESSGAEPATARREGEPTQPAEPEPAEDRPAAPARPPRPPGPPQPTGVPLWRQEPFDRITLTESAGGAVLKVQPLDLTDRKPPERPEPDDKLRIELFDRPGKTYEVNWGAIARLELYEQMVLDEARSLAAEGRLREAFDGFAMLLEKHPALAGLSESFADYLYEEAKAAFRAGNDAMALARLLEIHRRQPERPGLDRALGAAVEKLVEGYAAAGEYAHARALLGQLAAIHPAHAVVAAWHGRLKAEAAAAMAEARRAADEGRWPDALALCRKVEQTWPELPGASELAADVHRHYPRVVVGVQSMPAEDRSSLAGHHWTDWAARRVSRLVDQGVEGSAGDAAPPGGGLYVPAEAGLRETRYVRRAAPAAAGDASMPAEVVERRYADPAEAIRDLKRGEIAAMDRVPPWMLERLDGDEEIIVAPYAAPLVHCLVPNLGKAPTSSLTFRRALLYASHREAILKELLAGVERPGCAVLSGPFPTGHEAGQPDAAAADPRIAPRNYDPHLAMILADLVGREIGPSAGEPAAWRLVLAHPPRGTAARACRELARHWSAIGIEVELRAADNAAQRVPDDAHFLYVELAAGHPATDAERLFGDGGLAGDCGPALKLALGRLRDAGDPRQAAAHLRRIHRLVHDELPILPLWQIVEHCAHRRELEGVGPRPVTLYEHVERWSLGLRRAETVER